MTSHQLHTAADRLARRSGITHREALARLARRPRRTRAVKIQPQPNARPYWWQREDL